MASGKQTCELDLTVPDLDTNGIFDTKTEYIIFHFQRIRLLPINGIATPATKASLYAIRKRSIADKLLMEAL